MRIKERILLVVAALAIMACSSIDCPFNAKVEVKYKLTGEVTTLPCTLNVTTLISSDIDSLVLNNAVAVDSFYLPISYVRPTDILVFRFDETDGTTIYDTVTIEKKNIPHFESVDCYPAYFHDITGISSTNNYIESIEIANPRVDYDEQKDNVYIRLKNKAD